ncbi:hypothetical protein [Spirillospora sp. NPDC047279]|uniref:hypothetical protein n=1 Tax=Spirillospora sp. NPDC047279 TaxID=3155478 RepID=UPI0033DF5116
MRTPFTLALGVAALFGLAACGGESDGAAEPPAPEPTTPSATAPASPPTQAGGNAEVTPPGTKLKLSERAVVPVESGSTTGQVAITNITIEKAPQAAFEAKFGAKAKQMDPYFVRYTIEHVGGGDLSRTTAPLLKALGPGGGSTGAVVIGSMPGCESGRPGAAFAQPGDKYEYCRLQASRKGTAVSGVEYDDTDGGYNTKPVTWTR